MRLLLFLLAGVLLGADRVPIGLTASGATMEAFSVPAEASLVPLVVVVADTPTVRQEVQKQEAIEANRRKFDLLAVTPPAGARLTFPPEGVAYKDNPETHYIWRWLAAQAPDLVLVAGADPGGLVKALAEHPIAGRIAARAGSLSSIKGRVPRSEAHEELARRRGRSPRDVAVKMAQVYGRDLPDAAYIPALALLARLRLGQLAEVEQLAAEYREGRKDSLEKATGSHLAGHLLFAELAAQTGDPRYLELVRRAADLAALEKLHDEMSDSVFMSCPILARAGKLTGERKYFEAAARHLKLIQTLCLRPDGLYRHSPLNDAAWGRGNAFPALGLALTLASFPKDHPAYDELLRSFQNHMSALARYQDAAGMWHEVVDRAGVYAEISATAMIGTAMLQGVRNEWLDPRAYGPRIERAWSAVSARTSDDGVLMDVCESTGKQKTADDYLKRAAILGRDPRGGAMVMLFATEMAGLR